ncbi:MAG: hypothetical protein P1P86_03050 [Bacteroidales bacterium]|nr:hypothetical protein [Bacteroidales bacterium]
MKNYVIYTLLLTFVFSCIPEKKEQRGINLIGSWFYIENENVYTEVIIDSNYISFYSSENGLLGPYSYSMENNNLQFHSAQYNMIEDGCNTVIWENEEFTIKLTRLSNLILTPDSNTLNPYYLRRCNYFVNSGVISTDEAIEYLNRIEKSDSIEFIEEIYFPE